MLADREMVESASDEILKDAEKVDVAFLVVGDPFGRVATFPSTDQLSLRSGPNE